MNISWHDPDLYFSLCLLAGLATLMAIIHEFRRRNPGRWKGAKPLDGLLRGHPRPMKPFALLAVAALAFAVLAWHVAPDYVSPRVHIVLAAVRGNWLRVSLRGVRLQRRPRLARPNGQCVSHSNLTRDCGSPPSARCTYERTRQVCTRS